MFIGCSKGGKLVIPTTIEDMPVIEVVRLGGNADITEVVIPEGVLVISNNVFSGCKNLTIVTLPASLKSIDANVFGGCTELVNLSMPESLSFSIENGGFIG